MNSPKFKLTSTYILYYNGVAEELNTGDVFTLAGKQLSKHSDKSPFHYKNDIVRLPNCIVEAIVENENKCVGVSPQILPIYPRLNTIIFPSHLPDRKVIRAETLIRTKIGRKYYLTLYIKSYITELISHSIDLYTDGVIEFINEIHKDINTIIEGFKVSKKPMLNSYLDECQEEDLTNFRFKYSK